MSHSKTSPTVEALARAQALADDGRVRDAVSVLTEANRRHRDPLLESTLVDVRHTGFSRTATPPPMPPPDTGAVRLDTVDGLPTVTPEELSAAHLGAGIARSGCLLVPGLIPPDRVAQLVDDIDRTFQAFDAWQADPDGWRDDDERAWFTPFVPDASYAGREFGGRMFTRMTGGIWTVESPRMLFEVIETFEQLGLGAIIAEHLGEPPALSAAKCNLRRTPVDRGGGWHQDGSFLGREISTIDVWIALSDCGNDAPGLDVVPQRFDRLLPTGLDTVVVPHDVVLDEIAGLDVDIVSREYQAGDALFFDHLFLHRTADVPGLTRERYALETWFFGPSAYPGSQIPLVY